MPGQVGIYFSKRLSAHLTYLINEFSSANIYREILMKKVSWMQQQERKDSKTRLPAKALNPENKIHYPYTLKCQRKTREE